MNKRSLEENIIDVASFSKGSIDNVDFDDDNCLCGYLYASYNELVQAFGEPTNGDGGYKTNHEWHVETNLGYTFSIYDYRGENNPWHIGGSPHMFDVISLDLAIFLSDKWKRKVTIVDSKDQKTIEANVFPLKACSIRYKSKTEEISFIESN